MARFVCRECPGKACPLEIADGPEIVVPEGKCTVLHPPHGVRSAVETVKQVWEEVTPMDEKTSTNPSRKSQDEMMETIKPFEKSPKYARGRKENWICDPRGGG